jgi:cell division protein ZapA (FtsZ GTPase activity inhibitor)
VYNGSCNEIKVNVMAAILTTEEFFTQDDEMLRVACVENDADYDELINELAELLGMEE